MATLPSNTFANPLVSFYGPGGGGGAGSTLQSPASIIADVAGDSQLSIISAVGGVADLAVNGATSATVTLTAAGGTGAVVSVQGVPNNNLLLGNINMMTIGDGVLRIGTGLGVGGTPTSTMATFDMAGNNAVLTNPGLAGSVQTGSPVTISNHTHPETNIVISPIAPSFGLSGSSVISNTITSGGSLSIGSSNATPGIVNLLDVGAGTGEVIVGGNGGTGIVMKGSSSNAAAVISTDRTTGNLGVLTIGNVGTIPQLQFSDSGVSSLVPLSTGLGVTFTAKGNISLNAGASNIIQYATASQSGNAALGNGAAGTISGTTSATVPGGQGLYTVFITAPSDGQAAQVSCVAYWNGTTWQGGATGNPAYRINPAADFTYLTLLNTSGNPMVGTWTSNVAQILGTYS